MKTHANKVAAWGKLLGHCNALGATFNPGRESLKSTALTNLLTEAQKSIEAVHQAHTGLAHAITTRKQAFDALPFLGTRIIAALDASGVEPYYLADVNRIRLRFRYQPPKSSALKTRSGEQPVDSDISPANTGRRSVSYLGFDSKIENLAALIALLGKAPAYSANADDLSVESLVNLLAGLREKHKAVVSASLALHNARQHRIQLMFGSNGIYGTSVKLKKYVLSILGAKNEAYRTIRKIRFSKK